jgi:energy-converting hydrogenase A subunit R
MKKAFISDCEGPISKNDNAFEITSHYVPNGDKLFTVISRYDDVLADVLKRSNYRAGSTLKFVLPFFKAYGVTDREMQLFSARNLVLIPNSKNTLRHVRSIANAFIVSTSYEHYIRALCQTLDFPFENTYCTRLNLGKCRISEAERLRLREIAEEIAQMPVFEISSKANSLENLSEKGRETVKRLDDIFLKELASMKSGKILSEVNPIGGNGKAAAVNDIVRRLGVKLADVIYVGDSITDEEAFKLVRENGGLTVSFNGNRYAVENAEIAVMSEDTTITAVITEAFTRFGKEQTTKLAEDLTLEALEKASITPALINQLAKSHPKSLPKVKNITSQNMKTLAKESSEFRKKVRGEAVGRLG